MALENNREDPIVILLRKIQSQLDQIADEITTTLADEQQEKEKNGRQ